MDIQQAKQQIKNAMVAYFSKDEFGNYRLPTERQRPVFLPVSYTHLDVYKRQGLARLAHARQLGRSLVRRRERFLIRSVRLRHRFACPRVEHAHMLGGLHAVSYTHLDVYKRQPICSS